MEIYIKIIVPLSLTSKYKLSDAEIPLTAGFNALQPELGESYQIFQDDKFNMTRV